MLLWQFERVRKMNESDITSFQKPYMIAARRDFKQ
jgi:hypothetical protein